LRKNKLLMATDRMALRAFERIALAAFDSTLVGSTAVSPVAVF
jgi:hypothetical protein